MKGDLNCHARQVFLQFIVITKNIIIVIINKIPAMNNNNNNCKNYKQ